MLNCKQVLALCLTFVLILPILAGCADQPDPDGSPNPAPTIQATLLTANINRSSNAEQQVDQAFSDAYAGLAVKLLQGAAAMERQDNLLLSPLSAMIALSMAAGGADGETRTQMEAYLGEPLSYDKIRAVLCTWIDQLLAKEHCTLDIANSVWIRQNRMIPNQSFLQDTVDYFNAEVYEAPFSDETVADINLWVKLKTNSIISQMLDRLDKDAVMLLINTLYLEAQWATPYLSAQVEQGTFQGLQGDTTVEMLRSTESLYLHNDNAVGFRKYYKGGLSFVAMLPNEGMTAAELVASLTAEDLQAFLSNQEDAEVHAKLPSFQYDCAIDFTDLMRQDMPNAFRGNLADFSRMGKSTNGPLFIGSVIQKSAIRLSQTGTTASSSTGVEMGDECAPLPKPVYEITLDRPFVYLICDNTNGLPLFVGIVEQIG